MTDLDTVKIERTLLMKTIFRRIGSTHSLSNKCILREHVAGKVKEGILQIRQGNLHHRQLPLL